MLLIVITDFYFGSETKGSVIRIQKSVKNLKYCRLSRAVIADQRHPLTAFDFKIQIAKQGEGAEGLGKPLYGQHIVAADDFRLQMDAHFRTDLHRLFQHLHLIQQLFPAFRPADGFLTVERLELGNHFLLVLNLLLLIQPGIHLSFPKLRLFPCIIGIIALKGHHQAVVNLNNLGHYTVEKIPVMGYNHNGSVIIEKKGLQPRDRGHVQMIGGLVQKNHIRPGEQKLSKRNARLLTAGESVYLLLKLLLRKAKPFQNAGNFAFVSVAVFLFKLMAEPCVGIKCRLKAVAGELLHFLLQYTKPLLQNDHIPLYLQKLLINGALAFRRLMLGQVAQCTAFRQHHLAGIRLQLVNNDF